MTWAVALEALIVVAVYLVVDRAAFWFMTNTSTQVSGRQPSIAYADTAFPRLLIAAVGCLLIAAGKGGDINLVNTVGLLAILVSPAMLCVTIMKEYWSNRDA